jgi:hypothetical protein
MSSNRSFTIHSSNTEISGGRYVSLTPISAAKKASEYIFNAHPRMKKLTLSLRETTKGSKNKIYAYKAHKSKNNNVQVKVHKSGKLSRKFGGGIKEQRQRIIDLLDPLAEYIEFYGIQNDLGIITSNYLQEDDFRLFKEKYKKITTHYLSEDDLLKTFNEIMKIVNKLKKEMDHQTDAPNISDADNDRAPPSGPSPDTKHSVDPGDLKNYISELQGLLTLIHGGPTENP